MNLCVCIERDRIEDEGKCIVFGWVCVLGKWEFFCFFLLNGKWEFRAVNSGCAIMVSWRLKTFQNPSYALGVWSKK